MTIILIDGKMYWLGSGWGLYNKQYDCFIVYNTFVDRCNTIFQDNNKDN